MGWLLDVNAFIALIDEAHCHHFAAHEWFRRRDPIAFGASPIVENAALRVFSQPRYSSGQWPVARILQSVLSLKHDPEGYELVPDTLSITDAGIFRAEYLLGPNRITDAYLLGLAFVRGWKLVSFDRSLPWQAVRGATADLVFNPLDIRL